MRCSPPGSRSSPHGNAVPARPPRAAHSHSASVGRRVPVQRQYATASCHETCTTGWSPRSSSVGLRTFGVAPVGAVHLAPPLGARRPRACRGSRRASSPPNTNDQPKRSASVRPAGGVDERRERVVGDRVAVDAERVERRPRAPAPRRRPGTPTPSRRPCGTSRPGRRPACPGARPSPAGTASSATAGRVRRAVRHPGAQHAPLMRRAYRWRPYDLRAMPEHVHVHVPARARASPAESTTHARAVARDRGRAHALAGDARHRVERVPGREVERAPGPAVHAGEHRAQLRQPRRHARRAGPHPGPAQLQPLARGVHRRQHPARRPLRAAVPRRVPARVREVAGRGSAEQRERDSRARCSRPNYMLANAEKADKLEQAGRRAVRAGQGGDRARRRLRVRHRVLRRSCCSSPGSRCGSRGCRCAC